MLRETEIIRTFGRKEEEKQNPYIGFTSFQHFRDEALYSDVVVKTEHGNTETENLECYPIPEYVEQNGRGEGFYPDTSVAYIRILWKEFEPQQGEYRYEFMEDILSKAKMAGQTVMFRLMPHSTRACDDVPDWIKKLMDCPARPDGKRVKDSPTDPKFLEYFKRAIRKLGEHFDDNPILDVMDISLPGAWGEGSRLERYTEDALKELIDVYTETFRKTRLIGQVSAPWLVNYANETSPVGWRGDGTGDDSHLHKIFPEAEKQMSEVWKMAPVSFEAYWWLGEWKRRGWDIDEIIELTLKWHISTFNAKSLPIPEEWREKIRYWNSRMGYHFALDYFKMPQKAMPEDKLLFEFCVDNCGVAPIYHARPLRFRLVKGEETYVFDTDIDIRKWLPGKHKIESFIILPKNMAEGCYQVEIGIIGLEEQIIYWCTDAVRDGGYYVTGKLEVITGSL